MPARPARRARPRRRSARSVRSWLLLPAGIGIDGEGDPVSVARLLAVPPEQGTDGGQVLLEELRPFVGAGQADFGLDGGAGDFLAVEGGPVEEHGGVAPQS